MKMVDLKIIDLRKKHGITQKQLADAIGVAQSAVSQWESGLNEPKASYIIAIAKFFNCSTDYVLGIKEL